MAKKPLNVEQGVQLDKQGSARTYNERDEGLLYNNQNLGIRVQTEGADRELLTDTQTQTMSSKTVTLSTVESSAINSCTLSQSVFNVDNNTLSNVEVDNLKSGVLLTTTVSVSINDANLFSAKAIKDYVDQQDTANSGDLTNHINNTTDAHDASAISNVPSGNLSATDQQGVNNELQSDIDTRELASNKGAVNGYCPLGADQKVPAANLPSYVDDIEEYANLAAFPVTGESGKLYLALDTSLLYRWSGSVYAEVSQSLALGETSTTAYRGDRGATAYSHSQATSGTHGITGSFVGTTDAQVITNKDIDGGVAANTRRITFPSDTLANLNALTRKEGTVVYATDTDKLYYDNGSILTAVGSGSGSGDLATYAQLKSDDDTGTWSTGNNATFLGGGSIAGTFTKQNATSPLNGTYSYTLVQAAGSLNDYIASDVQAVPLRSRGVTNSTDLVYTYDGSDNDIKWVVYDVTNATIVTPVTAYVKASSVGKTAQLVYDLPVTCTQVRFGAQVVVANSGKTLKFDDVQLSAWTPQAVNLIEQESVVYYGASSKDENRVLFTTRDSVRSNDSSLIKVTNTTFTKYQLSKDCTVNITATMETVANTTMFAIGHYNSAGTLLRWYYKQDTTSEKQNDTVNASGIPVKAGEYFAAYTGATLSTNSAYNHFSITASAISENVVQAWQDGTEWTSYTPTFSAGFGTVTNAAGKWKRSGSDLEVVISGMSGTTSSSLASVSLPSVNIDASKLTLNNTTANPGNAVGTYNTTQAVGGTIGSVVAAPSTSTSVLYFGTSDGSASSHLTPANGPQVVSNSTAFSLYAKVPIAGWSSTPTLYALPTSKENRFELVAHADGSILKTNAGSLIRVTRTGVGLYTIDYSALGLTASPIVKLEEQSGLNIQASTYPRFRDFISVSTTQATVRTGYNDGSNGTLNDMPFTFTLVKAQPDYTAPGVFVGQLSGQWQYDLTVTGTNWTTTRAVGVVYKCDSGQYRLKFNIAGSVSSSTRTSYDLTLSGVVFKNIGSYYQTITSSTGSGLLTCTGYTVPNTSTISILHSSASTTLYLCSGDVEIDSRPTWATSTP